MHRGSGCYKILCTGLITSLSATSRLQLDKNAVNSLGVPFQIFMIDLIVNVLNCLTAMLDGPNAQNVAFVCRHTALIRAIQNILSHSE